MSFRDHPDKVRVTVLLPAKVDAKLRRVRGRRSISEVVTAACCRQLDMDPTAFGITEGSPYRKPRPAPIAG